MTFENAREIFLNRGYEQVDGGSIYNPDKWRESIIVISDWLQQEPCKDWYDVPSDEMTLEQARQAVRDLRKMWAEHLDFMHPYKKKPVNLVICNPKEVYNKGFADGQKALAEHLKLCKEELLDKIRAEMDDQYDRIRPYNIYTAEGLEIALEIIDKYKAESEE